MSSRPALLLALSVLTGACAGVLGLNKRDTSRAFEHRAHVLKGINCLDCHEGITKAGDVGPLHLPATETCLKCHTKPHDTRTCGDCHGESHTRVAAAAARKYLRFAHASHVPSLGGQCVPCHGAVKDEPVTGEPVALRPPMAQCLGCHEHKDQFASRQCELCHNDLPSEHVRPASHVIHDGDFLREHGVRAASARDLCSTCHTESSCVKCHGVTTAALPWRLSTDGMTLVKLHPGNFLARHPEEARVQPALCSTCHAENFCQSCHEARKVAAGTGSKSPHPPGWVRAVGGEHGRAARLDPLSCASCHGGAGEMLCVGCHRVGGAGGNPHGPGFSSTLDKGKDLPCRLCHAP